MMHTHPDLQIISKLLSVIIMICISTISMAQTNDVNSTQTYRIDLPMVLQLAKARNLDVQIARARLEEAKANHDSAMAKFLPWVTPGFTWRRHEGRTQAVNGDLLDVDKQTMNFGPSINAQVDLGDAIYATLAAKQVITASDAALTSQEQDSTLAAANAYFDLLKAQALIEVQSQALQVSESYQQQINAGVSAGLIFKGDALRVQTQTERYRLSLSQAEQQRALYVTRLTQLLHLDPNVVLIPQENDLAPIDLVKQDDAVEQMLLSALNSSPEIKQSQALAESARKAKDNTVYGPLIPSISAQTFLGELGGGRGSASGNYGSSRDYAIGLSWRIGPGGLFDFTRVNASKARLKAAELNVEKATENVKRQLIDANMRLKSLSEQLNISRNNINTATETLRLTRERKQLGVGIVLEDIQAQQEMARAQAEYLTVITEYNKTQYELNRLLGSL